MTFTPVFVSGITNNEGKKNGMDKMFILHGAFLKFLGLFNLVELNLTYDTNRYYQCKFSNLRSAEILYKIRCGLDFKPLS